MSKIATVHIPADNKNLAINGNFDFWQRNTTVSSNATAFSAYVADCFQVSNGSTAARNYTVAQSSAVPTIAQSGYQSNLSYAFVMNTGFASPAAADFMEPCFYKMEGLDFQRIHQKTITIGFWFNSSIAGVYSLALRNAAATRSYVTTFTQSAANTWQYQAITITLDQTSSWTFVNSNAMQIDIAAITGTNFQTSTLNTWQAGNLFSASTATNYQATTGASFNIAQFSINEGSLGLGAKGFQRNGKDIQQELALCQRYFCYSNGSNKGQADSATSAGMGVSFPVPMRTVPSLTRISTATVRHQANDFSSTAGAISNSSAVSDTNGIGQCFGIWFNLSGFAGLTQFGVLYDRGTASWLSCEAGL